jgi:hypothetical protein
MPLTEKEREFLDAYVYEATHEPFGGPATSDLRRRQIYYADLHGMLTGYHREMIAARILPFGKRNPSPPPSPWANREEAELRNQALLEEYLGSDASSARSQDPAKQQHDQGDLPLPAGKDRCGGG